MSNQKILQIVTSKKAEVQTPAFYHNISSKNYTFPNGLTSSSLVTLRKSKKFKIATDT